ncbi:MAG: sensor domain-containing diguanylate cyclase [Pseudomonadota bacterium]
MKALEIPQRLAVVLLLALGVAIFFATYRAIDSVVVEQSRVQQQAITPVHDLVHDELLRPLYIAETFASAISFSVAMDSDALDEDALLERLRKMERDLNLTFFVASERTRRQYMSDGTTLDLEEGKVAWYFEAKARGTDFMADLGQVGDVHLYFDVAVYGDEREFLGYVGVGKRIQRFLDSFNRYKSEFGYDFLFVNAADEIMLTSLPDYLVTDAYIPTLDTLGGFPETSSVGGTVDGEIIEVSGDKLLITEFRIDELGWRLLLLVPLEARQAQITNTFVSNAVSTLIILLLLAAVVFGLMMLYRRSLERTVEIDELTGLPNRTLVQRRFRKFQRTGEALCVVIIDLDHFKNINDSHGHDAGDRALRAVANSLKQELREEDIVSRWGGEEFVMLLPAASIELGRAVAERARENLEALKIDADGVPVSVTASFGVAFGSAQSDSLAQLLAQADKMLYEAKAKGRNQVQLYVVGDQERDQDRTA